MKPSERKIAHVIAALKRYIERYNVWFNTGGSSPSPDPSSHRKMKIAEAQLNILLWVTEQITDQDLYIGDSNTEFLDDLFQKGE